MKNENQFALLMLRRIKERLPESFLDGFAGLSGRGDRILNGVAAVWGRLRERVKTEVEARYIARATGGARAVGTISLTWTGPTTLAYTLAAGQVLFTTPAGVRFANTAAIVRTALQSAGTITVPIAAEYVGVYGNVPAPIISAWAVNINDPLAFVWGAGTDLAKDEFVAGLADGTIAIADVAGETTGGRPGSLDVLAAGRGQPRVEGEVDASLRARIAVPPDAITPVGIRRAVAAALGIDQSLVEISEVWDHGFAWGVSGWGLSAWSQRFFVYILIPAGSDVVSIQALVDRIKPFGMTVEVREIA